MYANLHPRPNQSVYTVAICADPAGSESSMYDEVDVVAEARASADEVIEAADLSLYSDSARVVGVIDQSAGCILAEDWGGDLRAK